MGHKYTQSTGCMYSLERTEDGGGGGVGGTGEMGGCGVRLGKCDLQGRGG